jgi:hypothetical protein
MTADGLFENLRLEHFPCRCRAANGGSCGFSFRKSHTERLSAAPQHQGKCSNSLSAPFLVQEGAFA